MINFIKIIPVFGLLLLYTYEIKGQPSEAPRKVIYKTKQTASGSALNNLYLQKWAYTNKLKDLAERSLRIRNYEPFHIRYQFGHYPTRKPYEPGEKDWELLDRYASWGGGVIHLWYWNEWGGLFGKSPFEALNEEGVQLFVKEAHKRGLKVIPYVSPGFLDINNVIHNPEWSRNFTHLVELANDFDRLCPGSLSWRKYFFENLTKMIDHYDFDGIYWDGGISANPVCYNDSSKDHVHLINKAGKSKAEIEEGFFALWEDFIAQMYKVVKERDGIVVAHIGGDRQNPFKEKWWDYLLLGETVSDVLGSIEKTSRYDPYVLRFNDWSRLITDWRNKNFTPDTGRVAGIEHLSMAASIVNLQFPWLEDGSYGEVEDMLSIPGTTWDKGHWTQWMIAQKKAGLTPLGNASWAAGYERFSEYLKFYRQMTTNNTVAYIGLKNFQNMPFPVASGKTKVSAFLNDQLWIAVANVGTDTEAAVIKSLDGGVKKDISLAPQKLTLLKYTNLNSLPELVFF